MDAIQRGIILLLKSAVTGQPEQLPSGFSLEEALPMIKKHKIISPVYEGAVRCGMNPQLSEMRSLLQISYHLSIQNEKQMRMTERVFRTFEENGIDYLGFKGCVLKYLYPQPSLRPMGDADILIHQADHGRIVPLMETMGFTLRNEDDHVYLWESKDLKVELHKCLVPPMDADYYTYYGAGWRLAIHGEGHRYEMKPEDAYIFLFAHFARHYRFSGIGCRHVLDLYVYRRAYPDMDEEYIHAELKKLGLFTFYMNMERTLAVWFEGEQPDSVTELITEFVFRSGNWGSQESHSLLSQVRKAEGRTVRHSKQRALFSGLFPSLSVMRRQYPILQRWAFLQPVMWIYRIFHILLFRRKSVTKRAKIIQTVNDEKSELYRRSLEAVGLSFHRDADAKDR